MSKEFQQLLLESQNGHLEAVRSLLDQGVDPNEDPGAPKGWSPLMTAAFHGRLAVVKLLVERGARLDAIEIDGWLTALDLAEHAHRTRVAGYLRQVGAMKGDRVPNRFRKGKLGGWGPDGEV
ncbi:ankyrin repeat domain-containing protein [Singulisphaera rosea]